MTDYEIELNREIVQFNKKFADGEQHMYYRVLNQEEDWKEIEGYKESVVEIINNEPLYNWQQNDVYNLIPLYITRFTSESHIFEIFGGDMESIEAAIYGRNGLVDLLAPLQRAYNATLNRRMEFVNRLSIGTICVEDGSVDVDILSEEGVAPGKIIVYRQGSASPQFITPEIDVHQFNCVEDQLRDEMDRVCNAFVDRYNIMPPNAV